jgi:hypothetical protein
MPNTMGLAANEGLGAVERRCGILLGYHRDVWEASSRAHARFYGVTKVPGAQDIALTTGVADVTAQRRTLRRLKPELVPEWASKFFKCAVVHLGMDDDGNIGIFFRRSDLSFRENEKAAKWLAEYLGKPLSNPIH